MLFFHKSPFTHCNDNYYRLVSKKQPLKKEKPMLIASAFLFAQRSWQTH
ncbi:protein of unknown function [Vibrio tapetis subsp. tapetis]|uniref:Uncharacterized protein n=1 Tax=Vibrio tapetis subsp. tapetis TaxID=1671868 RepID=A0A2N8ZG29_9VIBR|nr:protein of unknown function [Vibrio tapetis subsp. tapetis]